MRSLLALVLLILLFRVSGAAQCLTDFEKIYPDKTPSYTDSFGFNLSLEGDVLFVGATRSDTTGHTDAGAIYVYNRVAGEWQFTAVLTPSSPIENMQFGLRIKSAGDYLVVGSALTSNLYIFKKPTGGWENATEQAQLNPGSLSYARTYDISSDGQTIITTDELFPVSANVKGACFVYHRAAGDEWDSNMTPQRIDNPQGSSTSFFASEARVLNDNRIAIIGGTASSYDFYIYHDASGNFDSYQFEAKLSGPQVGLNTGYGPRFEVSPQGLLRYSGGKLYYYPAPNSGPWQDASPACEMTLDFGTAVPAPFSLNYVSADGSLFFSFNDTHSAKILKLSMRGASWCDGYDTEIVYSETMSGTSSPVYYARAISASSSDEVACSWVTSSQLVGSTQSKVAVGTFSLQSGNTWTKKTIVKYGVSADNYQFGSGFWKNDNYFFVSAPRERTLDNEPRGAVYVYKKQDGEWTRVSKLTETPSQDFDQRFGNVITGFGDYVAISALSYTPNRILIYKGQGGNFSNPVFHQSLEIPPDKAIESYGNMVMSDNWLVLAHGRNISGEGPKVALFFYKKGSDGMWQYSHDLVLDYMSIFFKSPPAIDLEGETIVASNGYNKVYIVEWDNHAQKWKQNYTLTASDPDSDPWIFPQVKIDGSYFGYSVRITNDKIFIGAPGKDYNGLADVGAIYVYTKLPGSKWKSGVESHKILPPTIVKNTAFGAVIDVFNNTLITGTPLLNAPGKVYVLQARDYYWIDYIHFLTLEGDQFTADSFGYQVALDEDDFFISASAENNQTGSAAGALYVTAAPPGLRLEPPICSASPPRQFKAYPFEGTWSGNGITDNKLGVFDPAVAGIGKHEITYATPNCFYTGKLIIQVAGPIELAPTTSDQLIICEEGSVAAKISVFEIDNVNYQWFYRESDSLPFEQIPQTTYELEVNEAGEFKVLVSGLICETSHLFTVNLEHVELSIEPLPIVCDRQLTQIKLNPNYAGGIWQLPGHPGAIDNTNTLQLSTIDNGAYNISYQYTSPNGCIYRADQDLVIDRIQQPTLKTTGDMCNGFVVADVGSIQNGTSVDWFRVGENGALGSGTSISLTRSGSYFARLEKFSCSFETPPVVVIEKRDSLWVPNVFTPNSDFHNDFFEVYSEQLANFNLRVINRYGTEVFNTADQRFKWDGQNASSGVYYWIINYYSNCDRREKQEKGWLQLLK